MNNICEYKFTYNTFIIIIMHRIEYMYIFGGERNNNFNLIFEKGFRNRKRLNNSLIHYYYFLAVLEFELRASCLLGRHSTI
jgi:hypothetical protein